jgi:hypothetical protein
LFIGRSEKDNSPCYFSGSGLREPPPEPKREYVRFVVGCRDEDGHVEQGIFQAAALALEWQNITGSDADELICLPAIDCGFCVYETGAAPFKLSSPVIARF